MAGGYQWHPFRDPGLLPALDKPFFSVSAGLEVIAGKARRIDICEASVTTEQKYIPHYCKALDGDLFFFEQSYLCRV